MGCLAALLWESGALVNRGADGEGVGVPEQQARYRWAAGLVGGGRVLDAACAHGWGTAVLAESAETAVGVDFSSAAIMAARRAYGKQAEFVEGDLRELPFTGKGFDSVVCFEAIAHVDDPARVIAELHRVVRRGGLLLISAPNREAYPAGNPLHLSPISAGEFQDLLQQHFANVGIYRQQTYFASLLCDDAMHLHNDPAVPVSPRTIKLSGGAPGSELHMIAIATDRELPTAPAWLAIGEEVDYEEQGRQLAEWRERAVQAEAEAEALRRELG
jgi:SAM-dependent methyltransferase